MHRASTHTHDGSGDSGLRMQIPARFKLNQIIIGYVMGGDLSPDVTVRILCPIKGSGPRRGWYDCILTVYGPTQSVSYYASVPNNGSYPLVK